ncbi:MAG TPA: transaldolase [Anaerolineales bacterium]|nr:transaldolase [Anaerolineales bacterium]
MTTKLHALAEVGQSVWLDHIDRPLITSGGLANYVTRGLRGVTSNPAIFHKAITDSHEYDEQIQELALHDKSVQEIYEALTVEDSRTAADVLRPIFDETEGTDGFFSLEVNPHLAHDRQGTINEATRLFALVDRPNIMIKVPATKEGVAAFQELIEEGVNVNVTLMFSLEQYDQIAEAYLTALEKRAANVYNLRQIASVSSIFVSRLDTNLDKILELLKTPKAEALKGKIAIANAKMIYQHFKDYFLSERWKHLEEKGARVQRVLYGSTGTKDPNYSDVLYVDNLIGPDTVNTIPPKTLEAFADHGTVALTLESGLDQARSQLNTLAELGIDLDEVTRQLLDEGVENFVKPYDELIKSITEKKMELLSV